MIQSQQIALRCAAAMPRYLLRHNWAKDESARERYSLSPKQYQVRGLALIRQLDACKSDAARRLILGVSK